MFCWLFIVTVGIVGMSSIIKKHTLNVWVLADIVFGFVVVVAVVDLL